MSLNANETTHIITAAVHCASFNDTHLQIRPPPNLILLLLQAGRSSVKVRNETYAAKNGGKNIHHRTNLVMYYFLCTTSFLLGRLWISILAFTLSFFIMELCAAILAMIC